MLRSKYFTQITLASDGGEPKAVLRDPNANRALHLPFTGKLDLDEPKKTTAETTSPAEAGFPYLAGQPQEVEELYRKVLSSWEDAEPAESGTQG
jgi:hypothetical protein